MRKFLLVALSLSAAVLFLFAGVAPAQCRGGCPVMGQGCVGGCQQGMSCTCGCPKITTIVETGPLTLTGKPTVVTLHTGAAPLEWLREPGCDDVGLWRGDVLQCRFFAKEKCYRAWTGKAYGPPSPVPVLADSVRRAAPPAAPFAAPVMFRPMAGFGGGCAGGRCH